MCDTPTEKGSSSDGDAYWWETKEFRIQLLKYVHRLVGSLDDAEDIVQDLFVKAREEATCGNTPKHFGWFVQLARRERANKARRRDLEARHAGKLLRRLHESLPHMDPLREAMDKENIDAQRRALQRLSAEYRHVLKLYYFDDCSRSTIESLTGKSGNAVRGLLFRALRALRRLLDEAQ